MRGATCFGRYRGPKRGADFAMQKQLIATANQARQILAPESTDYNIHFHVGSAGSQTVPHLHVRLA